MLYWDIPPDSSAGSPTIISNRRVMPMIPPGHFYYSCRTRVRICIICVGDFLHAASAAYIRRTSSVWYIALVVFCISRFYSFFSHFFLFFLFSPFFFGLAQTIVAYAPSFQPLATRTAGLGICAAFAFNVRILSGHSSVGHA